MNRLKNKVAIITGGAGSIGQMTAQLFLFITGTTQVIDGGLSVQ